MLYSEFIKGTGCKENEHNYEVYKNLEVMYMNSDLSKEQIYEYGKKLVDNSKTKEQIELENNIKAQIKSLKEEVNRYNEYVKSSKALAETESDSYWKKHYKADVKFYKNKAKEYRVMIKELKTILG